MNLTLNTFSTIVELLGTVAFTVSGVFAAMEKKLDLFGVLIIGFVTAIGGGTLRDLLIGATPVAWTRDTYTLLLILGTALVTVLFRGRMGNLHKALFLFDALGLGLFTLIGLKKGLAVNLNPGVCIALGTITGCFGGVVRDILLNRIPTLFLREIYATACIAGGIVYLLAVNLVGDEWAQVLGILTTCTLRILAYKRHWKLPSV